MREGAGAGEHPGREERDPEEQVEPQRGADHLGDVGRHRDHLGLEPEADRDPAREVLAAELGEVAAGRDAEFRRQGLDHHRDQVGDQDHPEQQVAEPGAGGDVGGEVTGVDVGDGGDEGGAEEGPEPAHPARITIEGAPRRGGDGGLAGEDVLDRRPPVGTGGALSSTGSLPIDRRSQVRARDRRAVGVVAGLAELRRDQQLQLLGDVVLEHLGLLVDAVIGHPQRLGEVGLDQAVVADHLQRDLLPGRRQGDPLVGAVVGQAEARRGASASRSPSPASPPAAPPPRRW